MSRYTVRQRKIYRKVLNRYPCGTGRSFNGWIYMTTFEESNVFGFKVYLIKYKSATETENGLGPWVLQQIWGSESHLVGGLEWQKNLKK